MSADHAIFSVRRELQQGHGTTELSGIPAADRGLILERARELLPGLERWARRAAAVAPARCAATLLACAAATPREPAFHSLFLTKVALTLFAIDDLADGAYGGWSDAEIQAFLDRYRATIADPRGTRWSSADRPGQIGRMLRALCLVLLRAPGADELYGYWQDHMGRVLDGFVHELLAKRAYEATGELPSLDAYMAVAQWSIALPAWCMAALLLLAEPNGDPARSQPLIEEVARTIGASIRLVNDVRTFARERAEGKFNSLTILMGRGMGEAAAERAIVDLTDAYLRELEAAITRLPGPYARWGAALWRQARFSRDYYLTREFHHLAASDLRQLSAAAGAPEHQSALESPAPSNEDQR